MARYMGLVKKPLWSFAASKLEHIPRDSNEKVDTMAVMAIHPNKKKLYSSQSTIDPSRMTPILHYLSLG